MCDTEMENVYLISLRKLHRGSLIHVTCPIEPDIFMAITNSVKIKYTKIKQLLNVVLTHFFHKPQIITYPAL